MQTKWSSQQKSQLSAILIAVRLPQEIHRQMRSLDYVSLWKGLEYRNFLNYVAIVVLKDFLPSKHYNHLLVLFCAVRICSSTKYAHLLPAARMLFADFINDYKALYGVENITSNVHNLCHIVDEVQRFGTLQTLTAYPFENFLHQLKKLVRSGPNPLAQVAARLSETSNNHKAIDLSFNLDEKFHQVNCEQSQENKLILTSFTLSHKFQDQWFLTRDSKIVKFTRFLKFDAECKVEGQEVISVHNYFEAPFASPILHVFEADIKTNNLSGLKIFGTNNIFCKLVAIPRKDGTVFIPLLHTVI